MSARSSSNREMLRRAVEGAPILCNRRRSPLPGQGPQAQTQPKQMKRHSNVIAKR
jgi:hypothetical protein